MAASEGTGREFPRVYTVSLRGGQAGGGAEARRVSYHVFARYPGDAVRAAIAFLAERGEGKFVLEFVIQGAHAITPEFFD